MKNVKCPKCKGLNVEMMGERKKGFSVGKAVVGSVLLPGVGAAAGFIGKKGKYDFFCTDCGYRYRVK